MEARIARIESDVAHIKSDISDIKLDVRELRGGLQAANDSIAELKQSVATLDAKIDGVVSTLEAKSTAQINGLETRLIKWIIGTVITSVGVASSVAFLITKFVDLNPAASRSQPASILTPSPDDPANADARLTFERSVSPNAPSPSRLTSHPREKINNTHPSR